MQATLQATLQKMRDRRADDRGFTLIELLVVVVIIGVLVAIAIPVYLNYSEGAQNKSAQADVRGAITAVENYYITNGNVLPPTETSASPGATIVLEAQPNGQEQKITVSKGNTAKLINNGATYELCAINADGKKLYKYDSSAGGSPEVVSGATSITNCT